MRGHGCPQREGRSHWGLGGSRGGHRAGHRVIHTPSDSSPISKQKQARWREEPATCREKPGEKRQKEREKRSRGQRLVLTHLSVCPWLPWSQGTEPDLILSFSASPSPIPESHKAPGQHLQGYKTGKAAPPPPLGINLLDLMSHGANSKLYSFREPGPSPAPTGQVLPHRERFPSRLTPRPNHCLGCIPRRTRCHLQTSWHRGHPTGWEWAHPGPALQQFGAHREAPKSSHSCSTAHGVGTSTPKAPGSGGWDPSTG